MGDDDWKKKRRRRDDRDDDDDRDKRRDKDRRDDKRKEKHSKPSLTDRIFGLFEGPVATTLVKLVATGLIGATTISLTGILALAGASTGLLMSTVGLGLASTAVTWIFGGWKKQTQATMAAHNHHEEIAELQAKLTELEDRLANVEIIERFEDRLAARVADSDPSEESSPSGQTTYGSAGISFEGQ